MAIWKKASAVFIGGSEQIKQLKGRRIRARTNLEPTMFDPIHGKQETSTLKPGDIGLISGPHPTKFEFLLAFPNKTTIPATSLDSLMRTGDFRVVMVNVPTFKLQFEIED